MSFVPIFLKALFDERALAKNERAFCPTQQLTQTLFLPSRQTQPRDTIRGRLMPTPFEFLTAGRCERERGVFRLAQATRRKRRRKVRCPVHGPRFSSSQRPLNAGLVGRRERQRVDESPLADVRG